MKSIADLSGEWDLAGVVSGEGHRAGYMRPDAEFAESLTARVPGCITTDLHRNGVIPDPAWSHDPSGMEWIGRRDWWMRRRFIAPEGEKHFLLLQGVDGFATVYIDGEEAAVLENAFVPHRLDITGKVRSGCEHTIAICFEAPELGAARRAGQPLDHWNCVYHRLYVRKPQMSFGWDWARYIPTSGLFRPVEVRGVIGPEITGVWVRPLEVNPGRRRALMEVNVEVENYGQEERILAEFEAVCPGRHSFSFCEQLVLAPGTNRTTWRMEVDGTALWWPRPYGEPNVYEAAVSLLKDDILLDEYRTSFGIRSVRLLTEKDGENVLRFEVNGREVFCQGANWVPLDFSFVVEPERMRAAFELAVDAGMNMFRVWGGGIAEEPYFYELADRQGIMLWQDFMFACGDYPRTEEFRRIVREETAEVVRMLRNHPSIVLWCGNNENEQCQEQHGNERWHPLFYEDIPAVLEKTDPDRPYWPSSASSPDMDLRSNDPSQGDCHNWSPWHGSGGPQAVEDDASLFLSESGCQGPPEPLVMKRILPHESCPAISAAWADRMGQVDRLVGIAVKWTRQPGNTGRLVDAMRLMQREIDSRLVYLHRSRMFRGTGGSGGVIIWAFGEAWPAFNWSLLDYVLSPKAAFYGVKRAAAPLSLTFRLSDGRAAGLVSNLSGAELRGVLSMDLMAASGCSLASAESEVRCRDNSVAAGPQVDLPEEALLVRLALRIGEKEAASDLQWLRPVEVEDLPRTALEAQWVDDFTLEVTNTGEGVARMVSVRDEKAVPLLWTDNFFDLLPGETKRLSGKTLPGLEPLLRRRLSIAATNAGIAGCG